MAKKSDGEGEVLASLQAAVDQQTAARRDLQKNPDDRLLRRRYARASEDVRDVFVYWREIDAALGNRPVVNDPSRDDHGLPGLGVKVTNNDGSEG